MASGSRNGLDYGPTHTIIPTRVHKATIVWLHDIDQPGFGQDEGLNRLSLPNVKWICPTAPKRPITSRGGKKTYAWCDVYSKASEGMQNDLASLNIGNAHIAEILSAEPNNVLKGVGGIGLGATQALYFASCYAFGRIPINLQIVIGINGWLPDWKNLHNNMNSGFGCYNRAKALKLLILHGTSDDVVPSAFAYKCACSLRDASFPTLFKQCGGDHVVNEIRVWLAQYFGL